MWQEIFKRLLEKFLLILGCCIALNIHYLALFTNFPSETIANYDQVLLEFSLLKK